MPALYAFEMIKTNRLTAVAVVDADCRLVNSCAMEDLKLLLASDPNLRALDMPVKTFLAEFVERSEWSQNVAIAQLEENFSSVLKTMVTFHTDRVFLVDEDKVPVGIITLKEVLFLSIGSLSDMTAGESADPHGLYDNPAGKHTKHSADRLKALSPS